MLPNDADLVAALRTTQTGGVFALARYKDAEVEVSVEQSGTVGFSGSGEVQSSSSVKVFGVGNSLVPRDAGDLLSANGQELALWRTVRVRDEVWQIPLGVFRITRAGDSVERLRDGEVLDWSVNLTLADRFEQIRADDFLAVESPVPGNSVWAEVRRLSPIPVQEALGDAAVPAGTVYESRLEAIRVLMSILGGVPHMTREGVLTARLQDAWLSSTVPEFDLPGVVDWSDEITNDFYNQVQVTNPNDSTIVAYAVLEEPWNPRSVGNAGGRTYKQSAPIYTSRAAAQTAAETILQRVVNRRSNTVKVTCGPEALLLELGDVGWVRDPLRRRAVFGEVTELTVPLDPTEPVPLTLIAAFEVELSGDDGEVLAPFVPYSSTAVFPDELLFPGGGDA